MLTNGLDNTFLDNKSLHPKSLNNELDTVLNRSLAMTDQLTDTSFVVPLGATAHQLAEQLYWQQATPNQAKQTYLNTLAKFAVRFYLRCMAIESDWEPSQSQDALMQCLLPVADLPIPQVGRLECCAVLPADQTMQIPPEAWSDRVGYVAVQFEPLLQTAIILGFVPEAGSGEIPLAELRSLDALPAHLRQCQQRLAQPADVASNLAPIAVAPSNLALVDLSQWLTGTVSAGWQALETVINPNSQLGLSLRNQVSDGDAIRRAKLLDLGLQLGQHPLALLVAITSVTDPATANPATEILVQIHPTGGELYLPSGLGLTLLTEFGAVLQDARSRRQDNYMQLKRFRGTPGERFDIQVAFGTISVKESFVI